MQFLSEVVGLLHGGKRQCNGFRGLPLYIDIDNPVIDTIYPDIFAAGVFTGFEEAFINTFADYTHFTRLFNVDIIDETSIGHLLMFYLFIFGV